jgi:hypothetical protein
MDLLVVMDHTYLQISSMNFTWNITTFIVLFRRKMTTNDYQYYELALVIGATDISPDSPS